MVAPTATTTMPMRVLDLYAGLGGWSEPFRERGHDVLTLDSDPAFGCDIVADILTWEPSSLPWEPDLILASPPCEAFTVMNIGRNWTGPRDYPAHQPKTDSARLGLAIVTRTRAIIDEIHPRAFVIENPRGKLRKLPVLADLERVTVTYCQYGESRMKPTDLWGGFPDRWRPLPACRNGDPCHVRAPRGSRTAGSVQGTTGAANRAKVPYGLGLAVCLALEEG